MSQLEINILRACAGEIVRLPYDEAQRRATARLKAGGMIVSVYDDDQPTNVLTAQGDLALRQLKATPGQ